MNPRILLQLEGAAVLAAALWAYSHESGSWLFFGLLFLLPDLSMLGYLVNPRVGASSYNAIHTYLGPLVIALGAVVFHRSSLLPYALIWIAHIAMDRALGYGLKFPGFFQDTHLRPERHRSENTTFSILQKSKTANV